MNNREGRLLEQLKSYKLIQDDVERLKERLASAGYSITAHYGLTAGGGGGSPTSKVENLTVRLMEAKAELHKKETVIAQIDYAIKTADLTKRERDLIVCTINGDSLSSYARRRNIYKSHVYKIRDRALRKMSDCIKTHETCGKTG